jgi:hypothetical protein
VGVQCWVGIGIGGGVEIGAGESGGEAEEVIEPSSSSLVQP